MPDLQHRARTALAARLRELVGADRLHPAGTHTHTLADALATGLAPADVAWVRDALAARAKAELRPSRAGTVPAHAAWSSAALVAAAFAPWRTRPDELPLLGLGPFQGLRLEERLPIPHGGGTPNLDVALDAAPGLVGVESKLTEHLAPARRRPWRPAYHRPAMAAALEGGWARTFGDLLADRWRPLHLDAGQLVRHALSMRGSGELVLLFWEPLEPDSHPEIARHRAELDELRDRVGGCAPRLHALTYTELLEAWDPVAPAHVAALRARYDVAVAPS